jgi:hypothetical protein
MLFIAIFARAVADYTMWCLLRTLKGRKRSRRPPRRRAGPLPRDSFLVLVRTYVLISFKLLVSPSDKISKLKGMIKDKARIPIDQQCIYLSRNDIATAVLEDDRTISDCGVEDLSTFYVTEPGGPGPKGTDF